MKKTILYVFLDQWTDFEYAQLAATLSWFAADRFENKIVSLKKEIVESIGNLKIMPDYDIKEAKDLEFEALVLIGGNTWEQNATEELREFVTSVASSGKLVAAICNGSRFLGTCGLLNDVKHTSNGLDTVKAWAGDIYTGESLYLNQPAVTDKNIITANGTASLEFAREVISYLEVVPEEAIAQWFSFYKNGMC